MALHIKCGVKLSIFKPWAGQCIFAGTCFGDSGDPLWKVDGTKSTALAIVGRVIHPCGGYSGYATSIANEEILAWIRKFMVGWYIFCRLISYLMYNGQLPCLPHKVIVVWVAQSMACLSLCHTCVVMICINMS